MFWKKKKTAGLRQMKEKNAKEWIVWHYHSDSGTAFLEEIGPVWGRLELL